VVDYRFMTTSQFARKQSQLRAALEAATARLAPHFPNPAARATAAAYLQSLLSTVERKNSWQLAEAAGLANPYGFQHLLGRAQWDAEVVRDEHRQDVLAGLSPRRRRAGHRRNRRDQKRHQVGRGGPAVLRRER
jgi:SRSO17 transposase